MSKEYWEKRESSKLKKGIADARKVNRELEKAYSIVGKEIEKEIATLYMKYSKDNNMSYLEATKYLSKSEFKVWRMSLKEYLFEIKEFADESLLLELNTLAMKSRISRLEEMLYQINMQIDKATLMQHSKVSELLENTYRDNYYKTIFDIQKFKGVGSSFALIDKELIQDVLSYPWSGFDYSTRIWRNRTKLKETIKEQLTQMIIQGKGNKEVAMNIAKRMDSSYSVAIRLVDTEHAYMMGQATKKGYEETNVEKYQFLSTLDTTTSDICKKMDLKVFNLSDAKVNVNYPPMHCNCRSVTVPYIDESDDVRTARGKNGKTYDVPANMDYKEWYEKYVSSD